jgi:hypothetical protein
MNGSPSVISLLMNDWDTDNRSATARFVIHFSKSSGAEADAAPPTGDTLP